MFPRHSPPSLGPAPFNSVSTMAEATPTAPYREDVPVHVHHPSPPAEGEAARQGALLVNHMLTKLKTFTSTLEEHHQRNLPAPSPSLSWRRHTTIIVGERAYPPAHRIHLREIDGSRAPNPVAIACSYPKEATLAKHMEMLFQERPSVLVVLANDSECDDRAGGYFRKDWTNETSGLQARSKRIDRQFDDDAKLAGVEHYELTLSLGDQPAVSIPVVYESAWPDATALNQERIKVLLNRIRAVEETDEEPDGARRKMMGHCKEGVGRTGQLIGTRALQDHGAAVRSTESLIMAMRLSRSQYMAFRPEQQAALAVTGVALHIPVVEKTRCALATALGHLGIACPQDLDHIPLRETLTAAGLVPSYVQTTATYALAVLELFEQEQVKRPMLIDVQKSGMTVCLMLYRTPASASCLNLVNGKSARFTAKQFLKKYPAEKFDNVRFALLLPSKEAHEVTLYCEMPLNEVHGHFLANAFKPKALALDDVYNFSTFLFDCDIPAYPTDHNVQDLADQPALIADMIGQAKNLMLEFKDNRIEGTPKIRWIFNQQINTAGGALNVARCTKEGKVDLIKFDDIDQLLKDLKAASTVTEDGTYDGLVTLMSNIRPPQSDEETDEGEEGMLSLNNDMHGHNRTAA